MTGEVVAFPDMSDAVVNISKDVSRFLCRKVRLKLLTDSKCLFHVISKGSRTSEKRLMLGIAVTCEQLRIPEISDIGLVCSADNLTDGLTKCRKQAALRTFVGSGMLVVEPVQTTIRTPRNNGTKKVIGGSQTN